MSSTRRKFLLKRNSIASLAYQGITLVCGFILPRLIIGYYGSAVNGLISSITQFLGIITLCELGMGAVVPASLYKPLANKDNDEISRVIVSSEKFYKKIAVLLVVYVVALTVFYPLIIDGFAYWYTASLIIIIASSSFAQYFFGVTSSLLITADQKQYVLYIINGCAIIINLLISFLLIKLNGSIHLVKLVSSIVFIIRPVLYSIYVKRHYCLNRHIKYDTEPIKQKWNGVAQHLAYAVQEKAGVIILSFLSSLEAISVYSVYFLIVEGLRGLIYSVTSSLTSFLGDTFARNEMDSLSKSFLSIEWAIHTISVLCFSSAAVLIVPFVSVYTVGVSDVNYALRVFPYIICAAVGCRCLQMPYNVVVQAAGHFKETQASAMIEPVINIVLSVLLVRRFGLSGVALGMLVSIVYRMLYLSIYLTKHILYTSKVALLKRLIIDALLALLILSICSTMSLGQLTYVSWMVLVLKVLSVSIIITFAINMIFYKEITTKYMGSLVSWIMKQKRIKWYGER